MATISIVVDGKAPIRVPSKYLKVQAGGLTVQLDHLKPGTVLSIKVQADLCDCPTGSRSGYKACLLCDNGSLSPQCRFEPGRVCSGGPCNQCERALNANSRASAPPRHEEGTLTAFVQQGQQKQPPEPSEDEQRAFNEAREDSLQHQQAEAELNRWEPTPEQEQNWREANDYTNEGQGGEP